MLLQMIQDFRKSSEVQQPTTKNPGVRPLQNDTALVICLFILGLLVAGHLSTPAIWSAIHNPNPK